MASIRPYYDPEKGEVPWQKTYPERFETLARDGHLLTEYDRGHDFTSPGSTEAGAPHPIRNAQGFYEHERRQTYVGKPAWQRIITLLAGPAVNIVTAYLIVVVSLMLVGIETYANTNVLGSVEPGSYAEAAGLRAGDRVIELGGAEVHDWDSLCTAIDEALASGEDFSVRYERDERGFTGQVDVPEGEAVEYFGVTCGIEYQRLSFMEASRFTLSYVGAVGATVSQIINPRHTIEIVSQSSSIVGISAMASEAASLGPNSLALFAAAISLSLGFMNLLPIPPLDGGKIVLELLQALMRRPLSMRTQTAVSYLGLAFFLFIFCFAVRNDIMRLLGF